MPRPYPSSGTRTAAHKQKEQAGVLRSKFGKRGKKTGVGKSGGAAIGGAAG